MSPAVSRLHHELLNHLTSASSSPTELLGNPEDIGSTVSASTLHQRTASIVSKFSNTTDQSIAASMLQQQADQNSTDSSLILQLTNRQFTHAFHR